MRVRIGPPLVVFVVVAFEPSGLPLPAAGKISIGPTIARLLTSLLPNPPCHLISGLALATSVGVSAQEDVYPFSIDGGRRITERNNKLAPYVKNGVLFRCAPCSSLSARFRDSNARASKRALRKIYR